MYSCIINISPFFNLSRNTTSLRYHHLMEWVQEQRAMLDKTPVQLCSNEGT